MSKLFARREFNFPFMKYRKIGYIISFVLLAFSIAVLSTKGLKYGIDFEGGILVEAQSETTADISALRTKLKFLEDVAIQSAGTDGRSVIIQTKGLEGESNSATVQKIKELLGESFTIQKTDIIGARIGDELKKKSILASVFALFAIALYIWIRFEWPFAIGCFVALAHDLIIVLGFFAFFGLEFDMVVVAGLLSLAGYDCNDTIVTYDRVRDNLKKLKKMPMDDLLNRSNNETLSRTILTSLTTFIMILALVIWGGATLYGFSVAMLLGTVFGTYSSVFVAVPLLRYFDLRNLSDNTGRDEFAAARAEEEKAKKIPLPKGVCNRGGCCNCQK